MHNFTSKLILREFAKITLSILIRAGLWAGIVVCCKSHGIFILKMLLSTVCQSTILKSPSNIRKPQQFRLLTIGLEVNQLMLLLLLLLLFVPYCAIVSLRALIKLLHFSLFLATCAGSPQLLQPNYFRSFSTIPHYHYYYCYYYIIITIYKYWYYYYY